jgi:alkanesulfonate monooxygenase SsuD/methylene tetrahydromethanopterin reductase-like flavin-dependent oxidoreductase (luciferase family)
MEQGSRHPLTFGVVTGQHQLTWPQLIAQWQLAEELGFDSVFLFDHFMALYGDPGGDCLEASTLLSALALKTSRIKTGVLVYGNTHRHPAVFAKEMTTVDHISEGRLIIGIGTGWNEREHTAYSIPFPSAGERVEMLDESIQIMRSLFTEPRTTFTGKHYRLIDAPFGPKPLQPDIPIMVGGERPRMLKLIANHADIWDSSGSPDGVRDGNATIAGHCAETGRDPSEIVCSVSLGADKLEDERGFPDLVRSYRAAGASQMLFDFPLSDAGIASTRRIATKMIPALKAELI